MKKRMKFPNGFGSISELSGNRRRPWAVRKTISGHSVYLGYFASFDDAITFLVDYNKNPAMYQPDLMTFADVYRLEMAERRPRISATTAKNYDVAFRQCRQLHDRKFSSIKIADLQAAIKKLSDQHIGHPSQKKLRQLFHNLYTYAVKYQLIPATADISRFVEIDLPKPRYKKTPFNTRQLNRVKAIADDPQHPLSPWAMTVVMMCYAGPRPSEFLSVLKQDVKLHSRVFRIRHSKTAAGENRLVPISRKVLPYYEYWMAQPGRTLITLNGQPVAYHTFLKLFKKVMAVARCKHKPHECRHTCATLLDDKGANKLAIKKILGHATQDITDGVYTHKGITQLKKAIDKL